MFLVFVLFWILLIWGLCDGDLYAKEGAVFLGIWCALIAGFFLVPAAAIWFIVGTVLVDVVLLMKVVGQDVKAF